MLKPGDMVTAMSLPMFDFGHLYDHIEVFSMDSFSDVICTIRSGTAGVVVASEIEFGVATIMFYDSGNTIVVGRVSVTRLRKTESDMNESDFSLCS